MKDILSEIIAHKQTEIELQKQTVSPKQLQEQAEVIIRENAVKTSPEKPEELKHNYRLRTGGKAGRK